MILLVFPRAEEIILFNQFQKEQANSDGKKWRIYGETDRGTVQVSSSIHDTRELVLFFFFFFFSIFSSISMVYSVDYRLSDCPDFRVRQQLVDSNSDATN